MAPELAIPSRQARAAIVAAVAVALRDAGTSITNIESAIARTRVSEREVSEVFGSRRELLVEMVAQLSDSMCAPLEMEPTGPDWSLRLCAFGERVAEHYATSYLRSLYRIAITESIRHTGLGRDFYDAGPGRIKDRLTEFLRAAQAQGALRCSDPAAASRHFLSLLRVRLDEADSFPRDVDRFAATHAYVQSVIDVFSHGIGGRRQPC